MLRNRLGPGARGTKSSDSLSELLLRSYGTLIWTAGGDYIAFQNFSVMTVGLGLEFKGITAARAI